MLAFLNGNYATNNMPLFVKITNQTCLCGNKIYILENNCIGLF